VEVAAGSSSERGTLLSAIDRATIGSGATRYGPALRAAAGVLEASGLPRREVVLISDFQQTGWDRAQEQRLPPGVSLTPISVAEQAANTAVVGMTLDRNDEGGRERITVSAQLVNHGPKAVTARDVTIEVDGHRLEAKKVTIEPRASAVVSFAPFIMGSGRARVSVRLAPDALAADDVFHAVALGGTQVTVLIVESTNPTPDSSLYLVRALAVGSTTRFQTHVTPVDRVSAAEIESAAIIVLNDTRPPSGALLRALDRTVRGGAGLLVVLGGQSTWPADAPDLLPGKLGGSADRSGTRGGTLGYIDFAHPVFEIFSRPRSGDLTAPRVFRNRELVASGTVLARFDNGAAALVERRVDRGTVLAWTSTLDSYWNDLVLKPVFVPFVHQAMRHLARYVEPKAWFTVGEALDPSILPAPRNAAGGGTPNAMVAMVAVTPGGRREPLATGRTASVFRLDEQGFYAIKPPAADAREVAVAAVNVAPSESDLAAFDPAELVLAVTAGAARSAASSSRELLPEERERRQAIWWYLLAGGLILLVAEGIVASRLPRTA
jgi:hypothetical protein